MDDVEPPVTGRVRYPAMRDEVISALESLSSAELQRRWFPTEPDPNYYDDLNLNVHILYDDCQVLPEPDSMIGVVLASHDEADALRRLDAVFGPVIDDLHGLPDEDHLADPRWPQVMAAAQQALNVFRRET